MAAKEVTFVSKYTQHELVRIPKTEKPTGFGGWIQDQQRLVYKFQPGPDRETGKLVGFLTVREGQDKLKTEPLGHGWLRGDEDPEVERDAVKALMAHKEFGRDFWLIGHEPGTLYPRPVDWRADVRKASVGLDEETLVNMLAEEKRTHGRPDLITEAQDALELVRNALAEIAAAKEAEESKAAKAKPKAAASA